MSSYVRMWTHDKKGGSGQRVKHWISSCLKTYMWKKKPFTCWPTAVCGGRYMQALQILTGFSGNVGLNVTESGLSGNLYNHFSNQGSCWKTPAACLSRNFGCHKGWCGFPKQKEPSQLFEVIPSCSKVQKVAGKKWACCISVDFWPEFLFLLFPFMRNHWFCLWWKLLACSDRKKPWKLKYNKLSCSFHILKILLATKFVFMGLVPKYESFYQEPIHFCPRTLRLDFTPI